MIREAGVLRKVLHDATNSTKPLQKGSEELKGTVAASGHRSPRKTGSLALLPE